MGANGLKPTRESIAPFNFFVTSAAKASGSSRIARDDTNKCCIAIYQ
jgi:hypothetical protein